MSAYEKMYEEQRDEKYRLLVENGKLKSALSDARKALYKVSRFALCGTQMDHKECPRCVAINAFEKIDSILNPASGEKTE